MGHTTRTAPGCPSRWLGQLFASTAREHRRRKVGRGHQTCPQSPEYIGHMTRWRCRGSLHPLSSTQKLEPSQTFMNFNSWHFTTLRRFGEYQPFFKGTMYELQHKVTLGGEPFRCETNILLWCHVERSRGSECEALVIWENKGKFCLAGYLLIIEICVTDMTR